MNKFINKLLETQLGNVIDRSRDKIILADETSQTLESKLCELKKQYEALNLTSTDRIVFDALLSCIDEADHRIADLSYIAGIRDAVKILHSLDLIREMEEPEF